MRLTRLFSSFFHSEKSGGLVLIVCTILSIVLANSSFGAAYHHLWETQLGGGSIEYWINDGLMTIFFLLIGLELERRFISASSAISGMPCYRYSAPWVACWYPPAFICYSIMAPEHS
ncbi:Na+/H+ antiporter NhaA [Niabella sp. W65]|nr:Na+/H+ antiporter NhaA [Niabella sp. W65]MCH7363248.1 Na+/H+ antiporter NhaA [Niabella sp. W65]ULT39178.1 Na+/H+ antiporter NhaA [Niabella sp. I65]